MFGRARNLTALLISICVVLTGCGRGSGPDDTIRNAYAWYVSELKSGVNPLAEKRTELKEYVTDGFLTSIDTMRSELETSPFMDAQSFDARLSIEKVTKDRRAATVRIGLSGRLSGQHKLNVSLIKVDDKWKIDDVKPIEQFSLMERSIQRCFPGGRNVGRRFTTWNIPRQGGTFFRGEFAAHERGVFAVFDPRKMIDCNGRPE